MPQAPKSRTQLGKPSCISTSTLPASCPFGVAAAAAAPAAPAGPAAPKKGWPLEPGPWSPCDGAAAAAAAAAAVRAPREPSSRPASLSGADHVLLRWRKATAVLVQAPCSFDSSANQSKAKEAEWPESWLHLIGVASAKGGEGKSMALKGVPMNPVFNGVLEWLRIEKL